MDLGLKGDYLKEKEGNMYGGLRDYEEKRDYFRMQLNCPMLVTAPGSRETRRATCVNLSTRGMLVETDRVFAVGSKLNVRVEPGLDISPPLTAVFEILRTEVVNVETGVYRLAGIFTPVAEMETV